ncbi:MAG: NADH-quinone oxidoreductase subunit NuoF [Thermodesulfovibrionales bacterium]|nr:NADH-quinone oxidoreductase subunit NuoF [Thermodesulfovibrionales bacterium]
MERLRSIGDLKKLREKLEHDSASEKPRVRICCGTACTAMGSHRVIEAILSESAANKIDLEIVKTGCQGLCQKGPLMQIDPQGYFYQRITPEHVPKIINYTLKGNIPVRELLYRDSTLTQPVFHMDEVPFYKKQKRIVLRNNERIDPRNIFQYIKYNGYEAFAKAISSMTPEEIIEEITNSGLRGRGGAGFLTGVKWDVVRKAPSLIKLVVANGDEGDPGAFMDRSIMEGDPHSLIEGMMICAYAVGAKYGFIYVRHEYPLAVKNLHIAINQARELGLLGENILDSGFSFDIFIREGAGAFVCGEETALLASIEGKRGFPSQKPPFPAEKGLWSYPTCINNVETFANVPYIIRVGSQNYASMGTAGSKGTKVFALTGKIKNTGLIEIPMGITLREIIYDIGGGILNDRKLKAVQTGGPSGGCIPAHLIDTEIDFDSLFEIGSMMGSGGLVVMDETDCMVEVARFFLSFTQQESCGKCPPCRIGTYQMLQILERIVRGEGEPGDIERLESLGNSVKKASLCGLGKTAPNPVLSTIKYFREEYEEHITNKYCRAKVCRGIGLYVIDEKECFLCGLCKEACAFDAIKEYKDRYFIDQDYCTKCKACYEACPIDAVKIKKEKEEKIWKGSEI